MTKRRGKNTALAALGLGMTLVQGGCDQLPDAAAWDDWYKSHVTPGAPATPDAAPPMDSAPPGPTIIALTTVGTLVTFPAASPGAVSPPIAITGLAPYESIVGITVRPTTGALFGVGSGSRLYQIDRVTGAATLIGPGPFTPALSGDNFGVDFNPTVDRIRVVSDKQQNLRLHPVLGTVVDFDAMTPGTQSDVDLNPPGAVAAAAYTNSVAGATTTTLFVIDTASDVLARQGGPDSTPPSPNTGLLTPIGALGVDTTAPIGFDIAPGSNTAYAALQVNCVSQLYTLDLGTGAATAVGPIGGGGIVRGIALAP